MARSYQDFTISFHMQSIEGGKIITPFELVFQTENKVIETYCKKQWPYLMTTQQYSIEQLAELQKMKAYIRRNLAYGDQQYIHDFFYMRHWFEPVVQSMKLTSIKLINYDCKFWTDRETPYLEIKGEITLDIAKMLNLYFDKKYIKPVKPMNKKILYEELSLKLVRPFPLYITFRGGVEARNQMLNMITAAINDRGTNPIKKLIEKEMGITGIHEYKKTLHWKYQDEIVIEINDTMRLLKIKVRKNIIPIAGGYVLWRSMRGLNKI